MTKKTPRPAESTTSDTPPATPKPPSSKLSELRARYAQSVRGKAAAAASTDPKPKKRAPKKK